MDGPTIISLPQEQKPKTRGSSSPSKTKSHRRITMGRILNYVMVSVLSGAITYVSILGGAIQLPPSPQNSHVVQNQKVPTASEEIIIPQGHQPTTDDSKIIIPQHQQSTTDSSSSSSAEGAPKFHSLLRFIFVVGLEGTGHHFMGDIAERSPAFKALSKMWLVPDKMIKLNRQLFYDYDQGKNSLWNAHCFQTNTTTKTKDSAKQQSPDQSDQHQPNARQIQSELVKNLKGWEQYAQKHIATTSFAKRPFLPVPLNTALKKSWGYGMASYPNYQSEHCRKLNYPSLDLLYRACDLARVDCGHVYIYRDPAAILQSTFINRKYTDSMLESIHLYKSMYKIIAADMVTFPDRTWGCFGLLDSSSRPTTTAGGAAARPAWWKEVSELWGWQSIEQFDKAMNNTYKPPKPVAENLVSGKHEPYMYSMEQAHAKVLRLCQQAKAGELVVYQ